MAIVQLTTLWLNNAIQPFDSMYFPYMSAMTDTPAVGSLMASDSASGSTSPIRLYANGVLRAILAPGEQRVLTATLPACTPTQVQWLYAHLSQIMLVRDDRGRRFYAQYFTYSAAEHAYDGNADVSLTLTETTFSDVA